MSKALTVYTGSFIDDIFYVLLIKEQYRLIQSLYGKHYCNLKSLSTKELKDFIIELEKISEKSYELKIVYDSFYEMNCYGGKVFYDYYEDINKICKTLQLEITYFTEDKFKTLLNDYELTNYKSFLYSKEILKKDIMSIDIDIIIQKKRETNLVFLKKMYNTCIQDIIYIKENNFPNDYIIELTHRNQRFTINTFNINIFTHIVNDVIKNRKIDCNVLNRNNDFDYFLESNQIPLEIFSSLFSSIIDKSSICKDYFEFKAIKKDVSMLTSNDFFDPLYDKSEGKVSFQFAITTVKRVFGKINRDFEDIIDLLIEKNRIQLTYCGESYCIEGTKKVLPKVFVNFDDELQSIFILMHELGHAVSSYYSNNNTFFNTSVYLFGSESFAVFSEIILYNELKHCSVRHSEYFIEYLLNYVFTNSVLFDWEYSLLQEEIDDCLSANSISNLWQSSYMKFFSEAVAFLPEERMGWIFNSSIIDNSYIGFKKCFDIMLSLAFFYLYSNDPLIFKNKIVDFLSKGKSVTLIELLEIIGIQKDDESIWINSLEVIEKFVELYKFQS